ncbi:uncharacterized protein PAC_00077 [Phialocephala subalpina]|uniref:Peptidase A1 domain-containing protein n=1 Tax=Phialocephala subalpina TaxID=576137 RepID=A0A1L7WBQ1_9HELO|nr:uncharacterized protein PAC_00077 [Phialocephala subalpina]
MPLEAFLGLLIASPPAQQAVLSIPIPIVAQRMLLSCVFCIFYSHANEHWPRIVPLQLATMAWSVKKVFRALIKIMAVLWFLCYGLDYIFLRLIPSKELAWQRAQASQGSRCAALMPALSTQDSAHWKNSTHGSIVDLRWIDSAITANLTVGNQQFNLIVDTGSSLLWVAGVDFPCLDLATNKSKPYCNMGTGPRYIIPATFVHSPGITFSHTYPKQTIEGKIGCEQVVTIGDLSIGHQEIGVATTGFFGQGGTFPTSVGISGLLVNDTQGPGGYLGLGKIPNVQHTDKWATAPIITKGIMAHLQQLIIRHPAIQGYRIGIESIAYGKGDSENVCHSQNDPTTRTRFQAVIDSGSSYNLLPSQVAKSILDLYDPAAYPSSFNPNVYVVNCNSKPPRLGLKIGGEMFRHNGEDMIFQGHPGGVCMPSVQPNTLAWGENILGLPFLKNVVALFDVENTVMRFAAKEETPPASTESIRSGPRSSESPKCSGSMMEISQKMITGELSAGDCFSFQD